MPDDPDYRKKLTSSTNNAPKRQLLIEIDLLIIWRFEFSKIQIYPKNVYLILFVEGTWFNSHKTVKYLSSDGSRKGKIDAAISKGNFTSPHKTSILSEKKDHCVLSQ